MAYKSKTGFRAGRETRNAMMRQNKNVRTAYTGAGGFSTNLAPSSTVSGQPKFYSPLHTPSNWQIPTRRKEIYQWSVDSNTVIQKDDLCYEEIKKFVYHDIEGLNDLDNLAVRPSSIAIDDLTGGILLENISSQKIVGGTGDYRQPVHVSQQYCKNKKFVKIKASGSYRTASLSEEHPIYVIDGNCVTNKYLEHRDKRAQNKKYSSGNCVATMKDFYEQHPWEVKMKRADEVKLRDFVLTPVPKLKDPLFKDLTNGFCWLLGNALADANISEGLQKNKPNSRCSMVRFNCCAKEIETINAIKHELLSRYGRYKEREHTESKNCIQVSIYSNDAYDDFSAFITGKLQRKKLTDKILHLEKEQILSLLGGYFDGDGFFISKDKTLAASTTGKDLSDQIHSLLLICGIQSTIRKNIFRSGISGEKRVRIEGTKYTVTIPKHEIHKIAPYLKGTKTSEYQKEVKAHNSRFFYTDESGNRYLASRVESIEVYPYTGYCYDVQIDPERSFVAGGFKVSNCRFFANYEPKVAAALDFYSQFPVSEFDNVCDDPVVKKFYDDLKRELRILHWLRLTAYEYYCLGDVFVFCDIHCDICSSTGIVPGSFDEETNTYQTCNHQGGSFTSMTILNPDWIEVQSSFVSPDNEIITIVPDQNLRNIVSRKAPKEIYDRIPDHLKQQIAQGRPIQLNPLCVTHLAYNRLGYQPYGRSIIMRLFRTLAYKDKLTQAQWIVADRHIVPVRVVKVGNNEFPASQQDVAEVQSQLFATANDPNLTLVTHHAFEYDWIGACHSADTEVLTRRGFLSYSDVLDTDEIATYNRETGTLEYQPIVNRYEYDYDSSKDGKMIQFAGKHFDLAVTRNHKMYARERVWNNDRNGYDHGDFSLIEASAIGENSKFLGSVNWDGVLKDGRYTEKPEMVERTSTPEEIAAVQEQLLATSNDPDLTLNLSHTFDYGNWDHLKHLSLDDYLRFVGYFVSEGGYSETGNNPETNDRYITGIYISQNSNSPYIDEIQSTLAKVGDVHTRYDDSYSAVNEQMYIYSAALARQCAKDFGKGCANKRLPDWILNLPKRELEILLNALMNGDGNRRILESNKERFKYTTTSKLLADQVQEIVFKLGYNPKVSTSESDNPDHNTCFIVYWSADSLMCERSVKDRNISEIDYTGKVWCFEIENGVFVTRRNGKLGIHGNSGKTLQLSKEWDNINQELLDGLMINQALLNGEGPNYSSASIGIEAMIARLESFRGTLAEFVEERIYRPIAIMRGFTKSDELGNPIPNYPKVKWKELKLRDDTQRKNLVLQLSDKSKISDQTLLEYLGFDYDVEVARMRVESVVSQFYGFGGGEDGGGGPGGPPDGGGPPGGGGPPPMGDDGPPMGSPADSGGMAPAGGPPPGAGGPPQASRPMTQMTPQSSTGIRPRVTRHPKVTKTQKVEEVPPPPKHNMTGPEQKLWAAIRYGQQHGHIRRKIHPFYKPDQTRRFIIDFAIPELMLGLEVDGFVWHGNEEKKKLDFERDNFLASKGWVMYRWPEKEINEHLKDKVYKELLELIQMREKQLGMSK